jgi:hypothetical protein
MPTGRQYRLGRNCVLSIDGVVLQSIQDVSVRVIPDEIDVHNGGEACQSVVVVRRTIHVSFSLIDVREALFLGQRMELSFGQSPRPKTCLVAVSGGHVVKSFTATVHDLDEDQPLRSNVGTRWLLKQWGKAQG